MDEKVDKIVYSSAIMLIISNDGRMRNDTLLRPKIIIFHQ
jgi:hypothetical protein